MTIHVPTIPDIANGDLGTAEWAELVKIYLDFLKRPPYCWVFSSVGGSAASGAYAVVNYDTEGKDLYGMHSSTTHSSRITPDLDTACVLHVHSFVRFQSHSSAPAWPSAATRWNLKMNLRSNSNADTTLATGTSLLTREFAPTPDVATNNWASTVLEINADVPYAPGDYYETFVQQTSGLQLLIDGGGAVTGCVVSFATTSS